MTQMEILEEFRKLSPRERLEVIEAVIHLLREDLEQPLIMKQRLRVAAEALLPDYAEDAELAAFTELDGEDFHVQR
jgi:hypothetical protein